MSARRHALGAAAFAVLAVLLWWLSRNPVDVFPPVLDPPVDGSIRRTVTTTWLLLAATVAAGLAMVLATLAVLRRYPRAEA